MKANDAVLRVWCGAKMPIATPGRLRRVHRPASRTRMQQLVLVAEDSEQ